MERLERVAHFLDSQKTLLFYADTKNAFKDVLCAMDDEDFETVTKKLVLVVLHEGPIGQVIHFDKQQEGFAVLQLTVPRDIPQQVLRWSIAHELGHVCQGRNWRDDDGNKLEDYATAKAAKWGFEFTDEVKTYLDEHRKKLE
jgi:hypothetical protein